MFGWYRNNVPDDLLYDARARAGFPLGGKTTAHLSYDRERYRTPLLSGGTQESDADRIVAGLVFRF